MAKRIRNIPRFSCLNQMAIICAEHFATFFIRRPSVLHMSRCWWLHQSLRAFFLRSYARAHDNKLFRMHNTNVFADNSINFVSGWCCAAHSVYVRCDIVTTASDAHSGKRTQSHSISCSAFCFRDETILNIYATNGPKREARKKRKIQSK